MEKENTTELLKHYHRTKIIATVGPATHSYEAVLKLVASGADGIRINFSHGNDDERLEQIKWVRKAAKECGKPVAIIQDLQGPKIRLGDFDGVVTVQAGQSLRFRYNADYEREGILPVQYDISKKVKRGERLYLYDGKIRTTVSSVKEGVVHAMAENDGILIARKGINLPDTNFEGDILTDKDHKDIVFGSEHDVDYVALSFVQSADDINQLRKLLENLGSTARIIAKIETRAATDFLEEIIMAADVTIVARGDLAVETEPEFVPVFQRQIIGLGLKHDKPTIIATQMMATMTESSEPTRAEVSDVATAVFLGADAVMLSDETAAGKYPIETVKMMRRIIKYSQQNSPLKTIYDDEPVDARTKQGAISKAIITLADALDAAAIVAETKSGATAYKIAARRPDQPIVAITSVPRVAQQLAIVYAVQSLVRKDQHLQVQKTTDWLRTARVLKKGNIVVTVSGQHPGVVGMTDTIKVRVIE